ncbi:MAG: porin, partial [Planctomycetota bacterium]
MSHGVRAAGVLALAAGLAAAGEDEFDRGLARLELRAAAQAASERAERPSRERITLGGDDGASLWVGGTLQTRYQASFRDGDGLGSEDDTLGFSIRRLRIRLEGKLPDDRASFRIRTESAPGSETRLLEAYVDFRPVEGLRLRVGQSINRFSRIW